MLTGFENNGSDISDERIAHMASLYGINPGLACEQPDLRTSVLRWNSAFLAAYHRASGELITEVQA